MFRKAVFSVIFVFSVAMAGSLTAIAQLAPVSGRVVIQPANGKPTPVAGALVEVYRTDIKATLPSTKTDKNGNFSFAGLPATGDYIFAVSGLNIQPQIYPGIKAGGDALSLVVSAGNGEKFTEEQIRSAAAGSAGSTADLTPEQKKQQAEAEAQRKEIEAKNEKNKTANAIISASFAAGNEALKAKNWDLAIQKYDEGLAADPEFIGSVPALSNNRGIAYSNRAVEERNKAVKETDATAKVEGLAKARKDLDESINSYMRSWNMLKAAAPTPEFTKANLEAGKMGALTGARDAFRYAAQMELVDDTVSNGAKVLIPEYIAVETDAAKKAQAQIIIADLLRVNGDYAGATEAYKKVLETDPNNLDALYLIGACYYALGAANNSDKAMYQEGANYLQKFMSIAPDTDVHKKEVAEILDALKKENVTPQKLPSTPTKKRGGSN